MTSAIARDRDATANTALLDVELRGADLRQRLVRSERVLETLARGRLGRDAISGPAKRGQAKIIVILRATVAAEGALPRAAAVVPRTM